MSVTKADIFVYLGAVSFVGTYAMGINNMFKKYNRASTIEEKNKYALQSWLMAFLGPIYQILIGLCPTIVYWLTLSSIEGLELTNHQVRALSILWGYPSIKIMQLIIQLFN